MSADWQIVLRDGTVLGDVRYPLRTDHGALIYVQARGVRHGSPEVLARLGRGDDVDASEYTFRSSTQIETAARELDWLNKGVVPPAARLEPRFTKPTSSHDGAFEAVSKSTTHERRGMCLQPPNRSASLKT